MWIVENYQESKNMLTQHGFDSLPAPTSAKKASLSPRNTLFRYFNQKCPQRSFFVHTDNLWLKLLSSSLNLSWLFYFSLLCPQKIRKKQTSFLCVSLTLCEVFFPTFKLTCISLFPYSLLFCLNFLARMFMEKKNS